MTISDIQIDWKLYPKIVQFLIVGQGSAPIDALTLLKLEIAERLANKMPQLRLIAYKEAFLLAVEMRFAEIEEAFSKKAGDRVWSKTFEDDTRREAESQLRDFGFFYDADFDDLPF